MFKNLKKNEKIRYVCAGLILISAIMMLTKDFAYSIIMIFLAASLTPALYSKTKLGLIKNIHIILPIVIFVIGSLLYGMVH